MYFILSFLFCLRRNSLLCYSLKKEEENYFAILETWVFFEILQFPVAIFENTIHFRKLKISF